MFCSLAACKFFWGFSVSGLSEALFLWKDLSISGKGSLCGNGDLFVFPTKIRRLYSNRITSKVISFFRTQQIRQIPITAKMRQAGAH